jgi:hypothetical protein
VPEPELDAYGVPIQKRQMAASTRYWLALVSLACAIALIGLAIYFLIGRHKTSSPLLLLVAIPFLVAVFMGGRLKESPDKRTRRIAKAAFILGILSFFAVIIASGNGAALNNAP